VYDNLHLHFRLPEPAHEFEVALGKSLAFANCNEQLDDKGRIRAQYRGMRIEYVPGEYCGRVRGSVHTFAQGSNVGVFTAAEVVQACTDLASSLGLPPEVFVACKLEAGVNIVVPSSPLPFLETLSRHKKSPFHPLAPPSGCLRPLEYLAVHADYRLKYYDKGNYAARQGTPLPMGCRHLLRFEVVFPRIRILRKLTGRTNLTLLDLAAPDVLSAVASYVQEQWEKTVRRLPLNYPNLSIGHAALLYSGGDQRWWDAVRPTTPRSTFKRNQAQYNQLQEQVKQQEGPHPYDLLMVDHMRALSPNGLPELKVSPKIGTILHTCNHVEFGSRVEDKVVMGESAWSDYRASLLAA
jgi:hypothetical protein